ncbi:MAG: tRNA isopentenyl-2-thiomethyl-A-37 hydroxylase MiaE [Paraglaciecola sp.]|nr:tRNA isopentenyl-2-thiomethyl-A-37 hydroxylase MiaE [Paraglaciecola sp.]
MSIEKLLQPINTFLQCPTPQSWIDEAIKPENLTDLLIDHCNCELKAAQTALFLIRRYAVDKSNGEALLAWLKPYEDFVYRRDFEGSFTGKHSGLSKAIKARDDVSFGADLVDKMVLLIKEELHHFQQVLDIMTARGIEYTNVRAGRYAKGMMKHVRTHEPAALIDKLICGAYIEARSCERFAKLAPYLDDELNKFYVSLLRSEARHFQDYLDLADRISGQDISERVKFFGSIETQLIEDPDDAFRFHSGAPMPLIAAT